MTGTSLKIISSLAGLISGPGIFWGFAGSSRNFLGFLIFAPIIRSSLSLEIQSTPPGCILSYLHCPINAEIKIVDSQSINFENFIKVMIRLGKVWRFG